MQKNLTVREMVFWLRDVYGLERSVQAIYNWIFQGVNCVRLPTVVVGGHKRINVAEFARWQQRVAESYRTRPSRRGRPRKGDQDRSKRACVV